MKRYTAIFRFSVLTGGRGLESFPADVQSFIQMLRGEVWTVEANTRLRKVCAIPLQWSHAPVRSVTIDLNYQGGLMPKVIQQVVSRIGVETDIPVEIGGEYYRLKVVKRRFLFFWYKYELSLPYVSREITFTPHTDPKASV